MKSSSYMPLYGSKISWQLAKKQLAKVLMCECVNAGILKCMNRIIFPYVFSCVLCGSVLPHRMTKGKVGGLQCVNA